MGKKLLILVCWPVLAGFACFAHAQSQQQVFAPSNTSMAETQNPTEGKIRIEDENDIALDLLSRGKFDDAKLVLSRQLGRPEVNKDDARFLYVLRILARAREATGDFSGSVEVRKQIAKLKKRKLGNVLDKSAKVFLDFSLKWQDCDKQTKKKMAAAQAMWLRGEAGRSSEQLKRAHEMYAALLGEDHTLAKIVMLDACRASDVSFLSTKEHFALHEQFEETFGSRSIYTADAWLMSAKSIIKPIGSTFKGSHVRLLQDCESTYKDSFLPDPSRQILLNSIYGIYLTTKGEIGLWFA